LNLQYYSGYNRDNILRDFYNHDLKKYNSQPSGPLYTVFHLAVSLLLHHFFAFASEAGPDSLASSSDPESIEQGFEKVLVI